MTTPTVDATVSTAAISAAVRAPSMHNSQPWLFRITGGHIDVFADRSRQLPIADPTGWGMRISCGAAIFNLRNALAEYGRAAEVTLRPEPAVPDLMARVNLGRPHTPTPTESALYAAIPRRHSNRRPFSAQPVPGEVRARVIAAAREEGTWLELLIGPFALTALAEITQAADRVLARDPRYLKEIATWTRDSNGRGPHGVRTVVDLTDGVPTSAGGPRPEPQDLLAMRDFGGADREPGQDFEAEPLLAVLGTASDSQTDQLVAGIALQRVLLTLTDAGLCASMLSQPIEVPAAREQLRLALGRYGTPQMVLRIGYGQPGVPTPRRPLAEVLLND